MSSSNLRLIAMTNSWLKKKDVDNLSNQLQDTSIEPTIESIIQKLKKSQIRHVHPIERINRRKRVREESIERKVKIRKDNEKNPMKRIKK